MCFSYQGRWKRANYNNKYENKEKISDFPWEKSNFAKRLTSKVQVHFVPEL